MLLFQEQTKNIDQMLSRMKTSPHANCLACSKPWFIYGYLFMAITTSTDAVIHIAIIYLNFKFYDELSTIFDIIIFCNDTIIFCEVNLIVS